MVDKVLIRLYQGIILSAKDRLICARIISRHEKINHCLNQFCLFRHRFHNSFEVGEVCFFDVANIICCMIEYEELEPFEINGKPWLFLNTFTTFT